MPPKKGKNKKGGKADEEDDWAAMTEGNKDEVGSRGSG
jgi:hypothetical protein